MFLKFLKFLKIIDDQKAILQFLKESKNNQKALILFITELSKQKLSNDEVNTYMNRMKNAIKKSCY